MNDDIFATFVVTALCLPAQIMCLAPRSIVFRHNRDYIGAAVKIRQAISEHQSLPLDLIVIKIATIWNGKLPPHLSEK